MGLDKGSDSVMENFRCVVERITYQNEQNGYSVIKCKAKGYNDLITVVGAMPEVHVGAVLTMTGEWKMDAKFGRQFSMISFEETLPATVYDDAYSGRRCGSAAERWRGQCAEGYYRKRSVSGYTPEQNLQASGKLPHYHERTQDKQGPDARSEQWKRERFLFHRGRRP